MTDSVGFGSSAANNWVRMVIEETDRVGARLDDFCHDYVEAVYNLLGMIPNATRRVITEVQPHTAQDHAAVLLASRSFNHALGAFILARKGMLVEATTLTRSALETVAQAILFLRDAACAENWLKGTKYTPGDVRKRLDGVLSIKPIYDALSDIAHANARSLPYHSVDIPELGYAISYGGSYRPKQAATLLGLLVDIIQLYLREFYAHYVNRLSIDAWPLVLEFWDKVSRDYRAWVESLPVDEIGLAAHLQKMEAPEPMPPPLVDRETIHKVVAKLLDSEAGALGQAGVDQSTD